MRVLDGALGRLSAGLADASGYDPMKSVVMKALAQDLELDSPEALEAGINRREAGAASAPPKPKRRSRAPRKR